MIDKSLPISSRLINHEADRSTFARSISDAEFRQLHTETGKIQETNVRMMQKKDLDTLPIFSYESFISRTWALVVVSAAILGTVVALWMLVYVFQKICDGTLNGNQVMGVMLLIGVMCLFASVVPWLLPPNETVCATRHFMHPLLLVLCFSILLVKSMQLRSLVTIGLGGSIPQVNQLLSLFFMVMVQVIIAVEWYIATSPIGVTITDGYPECGVSPARFLLLHIYPTVLLLLCFFYAVSVLKVKSNFNEGRCITCATISIIPIFAAWPVVYYFAPVPFHDPSVAVSVVAVAGILLGAIFFPKMSTIALKSKLKEQSDLSRSHSDATVYTGFSDYVPFFGSGSGSSGGGSKKTGTGGSNMYPVYGYTTNQFVPPIRTSPHKPKNQGTSSKKQGKNGFNGLNYVSPPHPGSSASPPYVKTYSDWRREYSPSSSYHQRNHHPSQQYHPRPNPQPQAPPPPSQQPPQHHQNVYSVPLVSDSHRHHFQIPAYSTTASSSQNGGAHYGGGRRSREAREQSTSSMRHTRDMTPRQRSRSSSPIPVHHSNRRPRHHQHRLPSPPGLRRSRSKSHVSSSRAPSVNNLDSPSSQNYMDYEEYLVHQRLQHSQSPSDGMILTASGLTDEHSGSTEQEMLSSSAEENGSSARHTNTTTATGFRVSEVFLTH